ncbi:hypothetical protein [Candidatus Magnetominusculus xianensis]|uniref:Glycosyltransferase RgtA/B/C/D-like domain-containing protein n=1 Tax=Candidatus Magnetominusculus xianensis TaxID=1748249 RepID=A0ABR5SE35_9BACT|nr:hypothetical protein [Candidatus Magnetominusculus xianensis]KWT84053.1 hypothetical protein ASN18_1980 [Candidatus Magnetominusculus xianensis]MBF0402346.1 hypothetical protein [Nitrospirota bacterium]
MKGISQETGVPGKRITWIVLTMLLGVLSGLLFLHDEEIVILSWKHQRLNVFTHKNVNAWYAPINGDWLTSPSRTVLLEDGVPLRHQNASQQIIVAVGMGRYNVLGHRILFSTSDNTDPTTNGRQYELVCRTPLPSALKTGIFLLTALSIVFLLNNLVKNYDITGVVLGIISRHRRLVNISIAGVSICLVVVPFLITRLPFFLYYPVVTMKSDFSGYYEIVRQLDKGLFPVFSLRTPGYPFFMKAVLLISNKLFSIALAQTLLSLLSAMMFVFAIFKTYRGLSVFAAAGMGAFISSHFHVDSDIALLSESLYTNCVILSFAFFILAVNLRKAVYFALCSFFMGYAVYTRPAGIFFAVTYCITVLYLFRNKYSWKSITAYAVPFAFLIALISLYNYFMLNTLSISNYGEMTAILGNITLLEEDEKYSKELNSVIRQVQALLSEKDKDAIRTSWDPYRVNEVVFNGASVGSDYGVPDMIKRVAGNPPLDELRAVYREILRDTIMKHPLIYIKKTILGVAVYFLNINTDTDIYMQLNESYNKLFVEKSHLNGSDLNEIMSVFREYYNPMPLNTFTVLRQSYAVQRNGVMVSMEGHAAEFVPVFLQKFHYHVYTKLQRGLFRNGLWPAIFFIVFALSAMNLAHKGAFILFAMGTAAIGHALIVSMAAYNEPRFSYTLEFIYYQTLALSPLLFPVCMASMKSGESC